MQKIMPCIWLDSQAEEAAQFYTSVFPNSKILKVDRYPKAAEEVSGKKAGTVLTVHFEIDGHQFLVLNGGPQFKLNEAVSFVIDCQDQAEVDYYWEKLTANGGEESVCGWLKDKFGLSWQVTPKQFTELMTKHPEKTEQIMGALLKMKKIIIADLEKAAHG